MGLPYLYAVPQDADDWKKWSFVHAANHYDMIAAVQEQKGQQLAQFILDPMDPDNLGTWMYQHQEMHNQVNAALGTSGFDLLGLDWTKDDEFQMWLRLNGDEHVRICTALGIG
jgi:hypothetical protein